MRSRQKTSLAVLREILGPTDGHEAMFAAMIERSVSWVKKASSEPGRIKPKVAELISARTGVSAGWLLFDNPFRPAVETDNHTPYTRASYDKWRSKEEAAIGADPFSGLPECAAQILVAFVSALQSGKSRNALDDLWRFAKAMQLRYGPPKSPEAAQDDVIRIAEVLHHLVVNPVAAAERSH